MPDFIFVNDGYKVYFVYFRHAIGDHGPFIGRVRHGKTGWRRWQYQPPWADGWVDVAGAAPNSREEAAEALWRVYNTDMARLRRVNGPAQAMERAASRIEGVLVELEAELDLAGWVRAGITRDRIKGVALTLREAAERAREGQ